MTGIVTRLNPGPKLKHGTADPQNYMELHVTQLNSPHYIWIKGSPTVVSPTIGGKLDPRMVLNGGPSVGWYQILCLENLELDHAAMAVKLGHHPDDLPRAQVEGFRQLVWGDCGS
jgi:hypothetical protein